MSTFRTIRTDATEGIEFAKNYIQNATFETNAISNWSEFSTSMSGGLPTGTPTISPVANFSLSTNTSFPISGNTSLQVNLTGVLSAGIGFISDEFRIEEADYAKPLTFSFLYKTSVGATNANWSGILGSQTFGIYLYDVTNSQWVQPSGFLGMNQTTGVGQVMGSFQTNFTTDFVNGQKYRFAVLLLQPTLGTIEINFDNFFLGKETSTVGTPVTDYIDYTPTCNWSTGYTISGKFRRIGDSLECIVKLVCTGAPLAASETLFSIPSGYTIDTTKLMSPSAAGTAPTYGDAIGYDISTTNIYMLRCQYWSTTQVKLYYQSSSTGQETAVTTSLPPTWSTNDTIIARFQVPIVGLSSSVQMSNATDTRVVAASYTFPSTAVSANTDIANIWVSRFDTHGAFVNSTGRYVAPVSGIYRVSFISSKSTAGNSIFVFRNGVSYTGLFSYAIAGGIASGSTTVSLNAGDYLTFQANGAVTIDGSFGIERMSGPSVVASSETVAARYNATASQSIGTTATIINFANKTFDTHSSVTTGASWKFTAPISGKYLVSGFITLQSASIRYVYVYVNGSNNAEIANGSGSAWQIQFSSTIVQLNAGDTLDIRATVSPSANLTSTATGNYVNIERIGN